MGEDFVCRFSGGCDVGAGWEKCSHVENGAVRSGRGEVGV